MTTTAMATMHRATMHRATMHRATMHRATMHRAGARRSGSCRVLSATSLATDPTSRGMVRPTVPNYALRRTVASLVALAVVVSGAVGAFGLLAGFGGTPAAAAEAAPATVAGLHVAQPGDTLWSIAARYRGAVAHDRYLDALIRANGSTAIEAGQAVWLP